MQVMVTFRHVEPSKGLREHAEEKVQRIHKFLRRPIEAHVILEVLKHRHIAEIQLSANHLTVNAREETGDLYSAIDLAMTKVERQVKKQVAKFKDRKGGNNSAAVALFTEERPRAGSRIRTQRVAVKPMTVDEALTQLKAQKNDFLFFKNDATETLSVIYRRKDGNYGLIEPELS